MTNSKNIFLFPRKPYLPPVIEISEVEEEDFIAVSGNGQSTNQWSGSYLDVDAEEAEKEITIDPGSNETPEPGIPSGPIQWNF